MLCQKKKLKIEGTVEKKIKPFSIERDHHHIYTTHSPTFSTPYKILPLQN